MNIYGGWSRSVGAVRLRGQESAAVLSKMELMRYQHSQVFLADRCGCAQESGDFVRVQVHVFGGWLEGGLCQLLGDSRAGVVGRE